jgi:hypothetical protein
MPKKSKANQSTSEPDEIIKKRYFFLKNINIEEIEVRYGLSIVSNIDNKYDMKISGITNIIDVLVKEPEESVCFYEENGKEYKCLITMKDEKVSNTIDCFWCRHKFSTLPIGCPIKYVNKILEKSYISQITKGEYSMRENITKLRLGKIEDVSGSMETVRESYFLTDGIFCSFNCVLAFIQDNKHNVLYKESNHLLKTLYEYLIGKKMHKICPAPSWRNIDNYGGSLSIDNYRKSFNKISLDFSFTTDAENIRSIMHPISFVYRKK